MLFLYITFTSTFIQVVYSSYGDQSPYFQKCTEKCSLLNCTEDGKFLPGLNQPIFLKLLYWECEDECKYNCMWKTTEAFYKRNWRTPQFYGKWPFTRMFGIQEPASMIFSILNMYAHYIMFKKFKKQIRKDAPLYWLWLGFSAVCINAWIWSTVFHTRDVPFTEFMDYTCAFSVILMSCYCMVMRIFYGMPKSLGILISSFVLLFFINHVLYLSYGRFDYGYNMKVNILVASTNVICWFVWSVWNRKRQPYLWKCAAFYSLSALSTVLEIYDFPPIFWIFDSHALWHLSTALIVPLFYNFVIDDTLYLKKKVGKLHLD